MDIYTQAANFKSQVNGAVDLRTGQYSCRIDLARLCPQGPLEVGREVILAFSMMRDGASAYGTGWFVSNTEFDSTRLRLTLLSGEQFRTQSLPSIGGVLQIKDCKLKDMVVKRVNADTLHVIYKDGTIEILRRTNTGLPYRIDTIQFENGERLKWEYTPSGSLERILDHNQKILLLLTYSASGSLVMADTRCDGDRYARIRFNYFNARLTSVTAPYDKSAAPGSASYVFGYTPTFRNGMIGINRVQSPMGGEESIDYVENGHQYANGQYLPHVTKWVQSPSAYQPDITRTYTYSSGQNFTGFPFSGGFYEGEDNLYLIPGDYDYWTEESCIDRAANNAVLPEFNT